MRNILLLLITIFILSCGENKNKTNHFPVSIKPVFHVNYGMPTADKPQSKLFFMEGCWWAVLPDSTGPTFWQRTGKGWKDYPDLAASLKGIPGRVDVWPEEKLVAMVGVADSSLTVFQLKMLHDSTGLCWESKVLSTLFPPSPCLIETATIAKDKAGIWWVAATANEKVCVWHSLSDGENWSAPYILAEGIDADDICVITLLTGGVGVIWSDQVRDVVLMRKHKVKDPPERWGKEEVADSGNKTADDHLNTVLTPDGTLWLTTKNSVDEAGKPQFVLRRRSVEGKWTNIPYLILENRMKRPSRPIVVAVEDNSYVFVGHGDNDRSVPFPYNSEIEFALAPVNSVSPEILNKPVPVIVPDSSYKYVVHNVTGPKKPFPVNAQWIILASDSKGNIYEADLKNLLKLKE